MGMTGRENVVKGLESLMDVCNAKADMAVGEGRTVWAGYASVAYCALALIREQEPVEPKEVNMYPLGQYACGACGHISVGSKNYHAKYCPECGTAVKWE